MRHLLSCAVLICVCWLGCSKPVASVPEAPSRTDLPLVPHPEYANWSQFPVGTTVLRKDVLASEQGDDFLFTTLKLAAKSEKSIQLETQTAIERNGERTDSDVNTFEYPAQFRLPKGMSIEQFAAPTPKAKKVGNEKLVVADVEYELEVYTYEDQSEAGPVDVKVWRSSLIPGLQAKKVIVDRQGVVLSASTTTEINTPETE